MEYQKNSLLISVIIPVYNAENTLKRCINSVLKQDYDNFEVILINDGSNDNSILICKEYERIDNRIRVFSQINKGAGAARNKGIKEANGSNLIFIDADDEIQKDHISSLAKLHNYDIVSCSFIIKWGGRIIHSMINPAVGYTAEKLIDFYSKCDILQVGSSCNKLFKKEIIDKYKVHYLEEQGNVGEDLIFIWSYLCHCSSFIHIDSKSYIYIENPSSVTHTQNRDVIKVTYARLNLLENLIKVVKNGFEKEQSKKILGKYHLYFSDTVIRFSYLNRISAKDRRLILSRFYELIKLAGYNSVYVSTGLFNKLINMGIKSNMRLTDYYLFTIFKFRYFIIDKVKSSLFIIT